MFLNDTATTEIDTRSLHDALPISPEGYRRLEWAADVDERERGVDRVPEAGAVDEDQGRYASRLGERHPQGQDRKSTRLNSSHANTSYAVFCLKKHTSHGAQAQPSY